MSSENELMNIEFYNALHYIGYLSRCKREIFKNTQYRWNRESSQFTFNSFIKKKA